MASEVVTLEVSCRRLPRRTVLQVEKPGTFREALLQGEGIKKQENQGWGGRGWREGRYKRGKGCRRERNEEGGRSRCGERMQRREGGQERQR